MRTVAPAQKPSIILSHRLLNAISDDDDPVALLKAAAREHIPIDPHSKASMAAVKSATLGSQQVIPDPEHRRSIDSIIADIQTQDWYSEQILYNKVFEPKKAYTGK